MHRLAIYNKKSLKRLIKKYNQQKWNKFLYKESCFDNIQRVEQKNATFLFPYIFIVILCKWSSAFTRKEMKIRFSDYKATGRYRTSR